MATSGLIIVQHQLPAGNCFFRYYTMAKLFLYSRLRTEKALSNAAVPMLLFLASWTLETAGKTACSPRSLPIVVLSCLKLCYL